MKYILFVGYNTAETDDIKNGPSNSKEKLQESRRCKNRFCHTKPVTRSKKLNQGERIN